MRRLGRLLAGAVLAFLLLAIVAQGVQYLYTNYAQPSEAGLLRLLEYLFRPREEPKPPTRAPALRGALTEEEIAACASFRPGGAVRIEHSEVGTEIVRIDLADGDPRSPRVGQRREHPISSESWIEIQQAIGTASFWNAQTYDVEDGIGVEDGVKWLIEVSEPERYHMVHRMNGKALGDLPEHLYRIARSPADPID